MVNRHTLVIKDSYKTFGIDIIENTLCIYCVSWLNFEWVKNYFLPAHCTLGPEEDPFAAVMCAVGAASQISYCL